MNIPFTAGSVNLSASCSRDDTANLSSDVRPDKGLGSISLAEVLSDIERLSLDLSNLSSLFYFEMLPQMISENEW